MLSCIDYRWIVALAAMSVRAIVYGITYTSGIVYVIVLKNFQTGRAETSWISSIVTTVMLAAGPVSGRMMKTFGWRITIFAGGMVAGTGLILSALSSRLSYLILSYGFVTGFGCGMAYMVASIAVPAYFRGHSRRKIAVAFGSSGTGIGTLVFSPIIQMVNSLYGWRGLFIILAGVAVQVCSLGLFLRPPTRTESRKHEEMKTPTWNFMRNPGFYVAHLGFFLSAFADSVIYGHLGEYAETLGISNEKGAYLYSFIGVSVTALTLLQGAVLDARASAVLPMKLAIIFFLLGGVATAFLLLIENYIMLIIYAVLFGANNAASGGAIAVGILEIYFGCENLELTLGVNNASIGIGTLLGAPVAGIVFEFHDSYTPVLIMVCVAKVLSSLLFLLVYLICPEMQRLINIHVRCPIDLNESERGIPNRCAEDEETALLTST